MPHPSPPPGEPIRCHLDVPDAFLPKARYALRTLLLPLGLEPAWVEAEPVIAYGRADGGAPVHLPADPAAHELFAAGDAYAAERVQWRGEDGDRHPILFGTPGAPDLVASAFFWLSGWQEHTTKDRDRFGRFPYAASVQAAWEIPTWPAVDGYRALLARQLEGAGVALRRRRWGERAWAFCPTHDIDYLRKWRRGLVYREVVPHLLLNRRREPGPVRVRRFGRFVADALRPGDAYRQAFRRMARLTAAHGGTGTFFLKAGAHGPHDVPYRLQDPFLRREVGWLIEHGFEVGLHPSFHAHRHERYLVAERDRLCALTGRPPTAVRQHYLRYEASQTARLHLGAGFHIDSTLAFAEHEGFRRGTCFPFQLYDLERDRPLPLWELPLAMMDGALFNRQHYALGQAEGVTERLAATCRRFGGALVGLWHNVLWDELDAPGWGAHFEHALEVAASGQAAISALGQALASWKPAA